MWFSIVSRAFHNTIDFSFAKQSERKRDRGVINHFSNCEVYQPTRSHVGRKEKGNLEYVCVYVWDAIDYNETFCLSLSLSFIYADR